MPQARYWLQLLSTTDCLVPGSICHLPNATSCALAGITVADVAAMSLTYTKVALRSRLSYLHDAPYLATAEYEL